jgi:hypothetical protein
MEDFSSSNTLSNRNIRPIALVSHVLQLMVRMQHIDELFAWLATTMVEHFGIISAQIWAAQAYRTGIVHSKLRASSSLHSFQALQVVESAEVRVFIERILRDQRGVLSIPVPRMFSQYQSTIFAQQNCLYWTTYFIGKDVLLPPPQSNSERSEIATPLQVIFSLFTPRPLQPSDARAISFLFEQSFRIAISRGFLSRTPVPLESDSQSVFDSFIPERIEAIEVEQAENPFNSAIVIPEKRNRDMYSLVDGKKNIEELRTLLYASQKEMVAVLQSLLAKGYIRLRDVGGNSVDISSFPPSF